MEMGNAYADIPVWDYLYQGLQMGINVRDVINILDRFYYRLYYTGYNGNTEEMWSMGLRLIDVIQIAGNIFILYLIDLYYATSDRVRPKFTYSKATIRRSSQRIGKAMRSRN
jgi:hypothetical protein